MSINMIEGTHSGYWTRVFRILHYIKRRVIFRYCIPRRKKVQFSSFVITMKILLL